MLFTGGEVAMPQLRKAVIGSLMVCVGVVVVMVLLMLKDRPDLQDSKTAKPPSHAALAGRSPVSTRSIGQYPLTMDGYQEVAVAPESLYSGAAKVVRPTHPAPKANPAATRTPLDQLPTKKSPVPGGGTITHLDDSYFVE